MSDCRSLGQHEPSLQGPGRVGRFPGRSQQEGYLRHTPELWTARTGLPVFLHLSARYLFFFISPVLSEKCFPGAGDVEVSPADRAKVSILEIKKS